MLLQSSSTSLSPICTSLICNKYTYQALHIYQSHHPTCVGPVTPVPVLACYPRRAIYLCAVRRRPDYIKKNENENMNMKREGEKNESICQE
jgi:hypothetical protein